jgi:hypothetical protein
MRVSRFGSYVAGVVVGVVLTSGLTSALASDHNVKRPRAHDAIVLCAHMAEDSAAHVRLVDYGQTPEGFSLVYRCERTGY